MKSELPLERVCPATGLEAVICVFISLFLPSICLAGSVITWGDNSYKQCNVPFPNADFKAIAAGERHALGLKTDGSVAAWGYNADGECNVPAPNSDFAAVSAGGNSLGLKTDGSVVIWGEDNSAPAPVPFPGGSDYTAISAGHIHSLALKSDGSIIAFGYNNSGQCNVPSPNTGFVAIAAGGMHSLGLKSDGSIAAWGYNGYGECNVPLPNTGFVAIAAGYVHSLGLKSDGSIVAWGSNGYGQCNVPSPNAGFTAVSAGERHSLGLKADGSIAAWGSNSYGQRKVADPNTDYVSVSAGEYFSMGLRKPRAGDLNNDAFVNFSDYSILADNWHGTPDPCDPNNGDLTWDNYVDIGDLIEFTRQWLTCLVGPAYNPQPADEAANISQYVVLQWAAGEKSTSHDVYFGTDFNDVNNADITNSQIYMGQQDSNSWDTNNVNPAGLDANVTYYWRIDESAGCTVKGNVWSFTTSP